jgi:hypothetical protein
MSKLGRIQVICKQIIERLSTIPTLKDSQERVIIANAISQLTQISQMAKESERQIAEAAA